jgi:hypothetical protein
MSTIPSWRLPTPTGRPWFTGRLCAPNHVAAVADALRSSFDEME